MSAITLEQRLEQITNQVVHRTLIEDERLREDDHRFKLGDGDVLDAVDRGFLHESADRRCAIRLPSDHVHDGARCVRCRGQYDDRLTENMRDLERNGDVRLARAELDRLDTLVNDAELALGRAVNRVLRAQREAARS